VFGEMLEIAARHGTLHSLQFGISTSDALQETLDRAVAIWRFCVQQVDEHSMGIAEDGEVVGFFETQAGPGGALITVPNRWVAYEREARIDVENLAASMTRLGIAERNVRVAEAQAVLLAASVREAAIEAGIAPEQVRTLGEAIRKKLSDARTRAEVQPNADGHSSPQIRPKLPSASRAQNRETSRSVGSDGPGH
jgi:hypothetical protein